MGWISTLALFLGLCRVAGTVFNADGQADFIDGCSKVTFDIRCQRFEGADVKRVEPLVLGRR